MFVNHPSRTRYRAGNNSDQILKCFQNRRDHAAEHERANVRRGIAGAEYLCARDAFGKRQALLDDISAAEKHDQQRAHRRADDAYRGDFDVRQRFHAAEDDKRRKGEDRARRDGLARRCDGLHNVVFEDRRAAEHPQNRHRDDGRRDAR